jgi:hypothetical protein
MKNLRTSHLAQNVKKGNAQNDGHALRYWLIIIYPCLLSSINWRLLCLKCLAYPQPSLIVKYKPHFIQGTTSTKQSKTSGYHLNEIHISWQQLQVHTNSSDRNDITNETKVCMMSHQIAESWRAWSQILHGKGQQSI